MLTAVHKKHSVILVRHYAANGPDMRAFEIRARETHATPIFPSRYWRPGPIRMPFAGKVTGAISGASMIEIAGSMVPFPDQMPEVFAETILAFLARKYPAR